MKDPKILYILIGAFCVFAIIAGIYAQFIDTNHGGLDISDNPNENLLQEPTQEEIKSDFNNLFNNTLNLGGFDTTGIQRNDATKQIVYSAYDIDESNDRYDINIHIPIINIRSELSNTLNQNTQQIFVNKANEILQNQDTTRKAIYSIDYTAYINSNILSLVIKSTLKEGSSAQRVIVQTYNYNLDTNAEASLVDLITLKRLNVDEVNTKIKQVVTQANQESETLKNMGYNEIYVRDLTSDIYSVDNAGAYFLGPNGNLYIVYAYGNSEFTSEMDIVMFGDLLDNTEQPDYSDTNEINTNETNTFINETALNDVDVNYINTNEVNAVTN